MTNIDWAPQACTLPTAERPLRVAEFDELFATALLGAERRSSTQLRLRLNAVAEAQARDLTERETSCCSFFGFTFSTSASELLLEVTVPEAYVHVLDGLTARLSA